MEYQFISDQTQAQARIEQIEHDHVAKSCAIEVVTARMAGADEETATKMRAQVETLTNDLSTLEVEHEALVANLPTPEQRETFDKSTREEQVKAAALEQLRDVALTAKVQNEAIETAAKASKAPGVTPETVVLQDPDAVLAVLASQRS